VVEMGVANKECVDIFCVEDPGGEFESIFLELEPCIKKIMFSL